jgi:tetratricopeptide (TPR) repeat protein
MRQATRYSIGGSPTTVFEPISPVPPMTTIFMVYPRSQKRDVSRMQWLFVIARNSSFTYKGRAVDVKQVGRELGVRYVLEGSVRKAGTRVRVTGQLIDATTGAHLWAERFDSKLDDIFDLHDELATSVVGAIAPQLERAEIKRAKRKPTAKLDAYDYYLRGMASFHRGNKEGMSEALPLFYQAIERDPNFASGYAMASACLFWTKFNGWVADRSQAMAEGARLAHRAIELGKDDAAALARGGHALANFVGDLDGGIALIDKALLLNPNLAAGWFLGGFVKIMQGEPDNAIERLAYAMRLSLLDSEMYRMQGGTALAHLFAGRPDEAMPWADKALETCRAFSSSSASWPPAMPWLGEWTRRGERWAICAGSTPRFAYPASRIGCNSIARNTWQCCPMVCEERGCQNESNLGCLLHTYVNSGCLLHVDSGRSASEIV